MSGLSSAVVILLLAYALKGQPLGRGSALHWEPSGLFLQRPSSPLVGGFALDWRVSARVWADGIAGAD